MRMPRFIPDSGSLVEVTQRTFQGRHLLVPSVLHNDIVLGVLGRAQRLHSLEIHGYSFLTTHFHLLLTAPNALQLSLFMGYFSSNLAREVARLTEWDEKVWGDRYHAILISDEEEAQVARMKYVLSNGCKENLVARPQDWPGAHCAGPLLAGETEVEGTWYDRTREYVLRRQRKAFTEEDYATRETVRLTPLPCWKHLSPEGYRNRIAGLIEAITEEAQAERARTGSPPLGSEAIRQQIPGTRPEKLKKSPAPRFHAFRKKARQSLYETFALFVAAFREASERLRKGETGVRFPIGSFPPGQPFIMA
jgi:hypothetical protein